MAKIKKITKSALAGAPLAPAAGPEVPMPSMAAKRKKGKKTEEELAEQRRRLDQKHAIKHQFGDPHVLLTNHLKGVIHDLVFQPKFNDLCDINDLLAKKTGYNYRYLSRIFSDIEHKTVERFIMEQKIEKVKELLTQGHSLSDISFELNYSSVAHLSAQFKMIVGITIREFRNRMHSGRSHASARTAASSKGSAIL